MNPHSPVYRYRNYIFIYFGELLLGDVIILNSVSYGLRKLRTLDIVLLGVLMGSGFVIKQFSIMILSNNNRLTFVFLITAIISYWYGPWWLAGVAGLSDVLGTFLSGQPYFPGFTVSAICGAIVYGLFFYRKKVTMPKIIGAQLVISIFINLVLNTFWLAVMSGYQTTFFGMLAVRFLPELFTTLIQIVALYFVLTSKTFSKMTNRLFN